MGFVSLVYFLVGWWGGGWYELVDFVSLGLEGWDELGDLGVVSPR